MLKAVAELSEYFKLPCQVSMEERMGCGIGACLVCACKTKKNGKDEMRHVCKDGPVFSASEVVW
jgi:dihydroorotate dehydrogenase electron transfer subunit